MSAAGPVRAAETTRADWQTPKELYRWLDEIFRFELDAAADEGNTLCLDFIDEERNALGPLSWADSFGKEGYYFRHKRAWCNPPYGGLMPWVERFSEERDRGWTVVALLPANTDTRWFAHCWETAQEIWFLTPRVSFIDPATKKPVAGNTTGSMIVIWRADVLQGIDPICRHVDWKAMTNG